MVFDNLIHKGEMPVTIGVFINPGRKQSDPKNRSFEYDTLSDRYARFLLVEILPEVGKRYKLTDDPECRAICGISSGGIWRSPSPGSDRTPSARCSATWAASRTSGGLRLSHAHPFHAHQANPRVPSRRQQRPGQRVGQLVAGQSGDGGGPEVQAL